MRTVLEVQGHKVGDRFRIVEPCAVCKPGSIVEIVKDEGDEIPLVKVIEGEALFDNPYIKVDRHVKLETL